MPLTEKDISQYIQFIHDNEDNVRERYMVEQYKKRILEQFGNMIYAIITKRFKISSNNDNFLDLVQTGNKALLDAIERFDPKLGNKFITFAYATVMGEICKFFRGSWLVHLPRNLREAIVKYKSLKNSGMPEEEIMEKMLLTPDLVQQYDQLISGEYRVGTAMIDKTDDESQAALYEHIMLAKIIDGALSVLSEEEQNVLRESYFNDRSDSDIADMLLLKPKNVAAIRLKGLEKVKLLLGD